MPGRLAAEAPAASFSAAVAASSAAVRASAAARAAAHASASSVLEPLPLLGPAVGGGLRRSAGLSRAAASGRAGRRGRRRAEPAVLQRLGEPALQQQLGGLLVRERRVQRVLQRPRGVLGHRLTGVRRPVGGPCAPGPARPRCAGARAGAARATEGGGRLPQGRTELEQWADLVAVHPDELVRQPGGDGGLAQGLDLPGGLGVAAGLGLAGPGITRAGELAGAQRVQLVGDLRRPCCPPSLALLATGGHDAAVRPLSCRVPADVLDGDRGPAGHPCGCRPGLGVAVSSVSTTSCCSLFAARCAWPAAPSRRRRPWPRRPRP